MSAVGLPAAVRSRYWPVRVSVRMAFSSGQIDGQ